MRSTVIVAFVVLLVVCGVRAARATISQMRAEAHERAAGYTTLRAGRYRNLWQLDPKTGGVDRRPGERP
jgi:hypothetical protein